MSGGAGEPGAGPELDAMVARALGKEVLGLVECYREPECGFWEIWNPALSASADRELRLLPVSLSMRGEGWADEPCCKEGPHYPKLPIGHIAYCHRLEIIPPYSSEIGAAWAVVERLKEQGYMVKIQEHPADMPTWKDERPESMTLGGVVCLVVHMDDPERKGLQHADTAPLAICRAALRAVGAEGRVVE